MAVTVRRLARHRIDATRWDAAVHGDSRPLPYGLSWWLDAVTDSSWEGLVLDDYRVVLPLPRLHRLSFIPVYVRPPYSQQLGPFGAMLPGDTALLLKAVPYRLQTALPLRVDLRLDEVPTAFNVLRRINYVLDLSGTYGDITLRFPKKLQQYLRRVPDDELSAMDTSTLVNMQADHLRHKVGLRTDHRRQLSALITACAQRGYGQCYQLIEDGHCLAAGFYPRLGGRTFNLVAVTTERGRKRRGMSRLLALVFKQQSGQPGAAFDFEGSELPGVSDYFAKFGGRDEGYYLLTRGLLS